MASILKVFSIVPAKDANDNDIPVPEHSAPLAFLYVPLYTI